MKKKEKKMKNEIKEDLKELAKKLGIDIPDDITKEELIELIQKRQEEIQKQNDESVIINSMLM